MAADLQVMPLFDQIIFLMLSPITLLCCLFITITFILYPSTRKMPGDILLSLAVMNTIICLCLFANALYNHIEGQLPSSQGAFCQVAAIVFIAATTGDFTYNLAFCLYIYYSISNVLKLTTKLKLLIHSVSILGIILFPLLNYLLGQTGVDLQFVCAISEKNAFPYFRCLIFIMLMITSVTTLRLVKTRIPETSLLRKYKEDFCAYYLKYVTIIIITSSIEIVSLIIDQQNQQKFGLPSLKYVTSVINTIRVGQPILLTFVRAQDPLLKSKLLRIYGFLTRSYVAPSEKIDETENWFSLLRNDLKAHTIESFLKGITLLSKADGSKKVGKITQPQLDLELESLTFLKQQFSLGREDFCQYERLGIAQEDANTKMYASSYAPKFFNLLRKRDQKMVQFGESFDLVMNKERIKQFIGPDSGKSGQFFFFTYDNRLVIKTISEEELDTLLNKLQHYANYTLRNKDSLLSLLYGVFTFQRGDLCEFAPTHLVVQRNLSQADSEYIQKIYDLKGSQFDRVTAVDERTNYGKVTLKDKNFEANERKFKVSQEANERLQSSLRRDANFLCEMNLMDYSLLVVIVDWERFRFESQTPKEQIFRRFENNLQIVASEEQYGVYYHLGIIDYLQEWNTLKRMEEVGKKAVYGNVDTSATHPVQYRDRFIEKVVQRFFD